jgi:AraC-like DNA-binding protein
MHTAELYAFGRSTANGKWYIDKSRLVNRLYFVNRGSATVRIAQRDFFLTEGKLYILPRSHSFSPLEARDFDHTYFDYYSPHILPPDRILCAALSAHGAVHFLHFVNALLEGGTGSREVMQPLLEAFLCHWSAVMPSASMGVSAAVLSAVEYIDGHLATVTTRELAERAHLCESYFIRLFRAGIGLSPLQYVRARRVLYAKGLLSSGSSVEAAAEACGYLSPSALYKAIRAETGRSPSEIGKEPHLRFKNS